MSSLSAHGARIVVLGTRRAHRAALSSFKAEKHRHKCMAVPESNRSPGDGSNGMQQESTAAHGDAHALCDEPFATSHPASSSTSYTPPSSVQHGGTWEPAVPWDGLRATNAVVQCIGVQWVLGLGALSTWAASQGTTLQELQQVDPNGVAAGAAAVDFVQLAIIGYVVLVQVAGPHQPLPLGVLEYRLGWVVLLQGAATAGMAVAAVATVTLALGAGAAGDAQNTQGVLDTAQAANQAGGALFALSTCIVAPVFEELLYRGLLLQSLASWMPAPTAVAISALVFSAAHLSPGSALQLAVLGGTLGGSLLVARGNLAVPTLGHGLYNATVLLAGWLSRQ